MPGLNLQKDLSIIVSSEDISTTHKKTNMGSSLRISPYTACTSELPVFFVLLFFSFSF